MTPSSLAPQTLDASDRRPPRTGVDEPLAAAVSNQGRSPAAPREWAGLAAVLLLSFVLQTARLELQGIGNPYYAATVRSMLGGWHTFFFASFDPAGFVAVDKPPLGFWVHTASAKLLGFSGFALILPQALATVGSVALLWALVRRSFGGLAGLFAASTLALTPVVVATGRTNTIDPLLVLLLLAATWALFRAIEHDRLHLHWLVVSAALIGLGFNVKMLQAYLIVPAWALTCLLAGRSPLRRRVAHLATAGLILLAVSFSWATIVHLTPPDRRPYVGSSSTDSPFDLAFGYNGVQRLLPASPIGSDDRATATTPSPGAILGAFGAVETGERGPLRLFNDALAGQIAWLLPLAMLGVATVWWQEPVVWTRRVSLRRASLILWGSWLLTAAAFFSVANQFHRYYLVMLAPPVATLVGAGLVAMWSDWRRPGWRGWLLPIALVGSGGWAATIAGPDLGASAPLAPVVVASGVISAVGLTAVRLARARTRRSEPRLVLLRVVQSVAVGVAAVALLLAPAIWSVWALTTPVSNVLPASGPGGSILPQTPVGVGSAKAPPSIPDGAARSAADDRRLPVMAPSEAPVQGGGPVPGLDIYAPPDPALLTFLAKNRDGERFVLATANTMSAAPLIIERGWPVAALGGFIGQDPILPVDQLRAMVERGEVRFFLVPNPGRVGLLTTMVDVFGNLTDRDGPVLPVPGIAAAEPPANARGPDPAEVLRLFLSDNVRWVADHCSPVPVSEWQTPGRRAGNPLTGLESLYDCGAPAAGAA